MELVLDYFLKAPSQQPHGSAHAEAKSNMDQEVHLFTLRLQYVFSRAVDFVHLAEEPKKRGERGVTTYELAFCSPDCSVPIGA